MYSPHTSHIPRHCHYYRDVLWVCWVLIFCTFISSLHIIGKDGKMETGLVMVRIILCSSYNLISCLCRSLIFHIKLFKWIHFIPHSHSSFFFFFPPSLWHLTPVQPQLYPYPIFPTRKHTSAAMKRFHLGNSVLISIKVRGGTNGMCHQRGNSKELRSIPL